MLRGLWAPAVAVQFIVWTVTDPHRTEPWRLSTLLTGPTLIPALWWLDRAAG